MAFSCISYRELHNLDRTRSEYSDLMGIGTTATESSKHILLLLDELLLLLVLLVVVVVVIVVVDDDDDVLSKVDVVEEGRLLLLLLILLLDELVDSAFRRFRESESSALYFNGSEDILERIIFDFGSLSHVDEHVGVVCVGIPPSPMARNILIFLAIAGFS